MSKREQNIVGKIGVRTRYVRTLLEMTQTEVAEKTGLTKSCVSRMESGKGVTASVMLTLLSFYSDYVRTDIMFSDSMWEAAVMEGDAMIKDKAVASVVEAKLSATEKSLLQAIRKTQNEMNRELNSLSRKTRRSLLSALDLLK